MKHMRSMHSDPRRGCVRAPAWAALAVAIVVAGCSRGPGSIAEGTVTIAGKPVESGWIRFAPANGDGPTAGAAIEQGRYHTALRPGPMRVSLQGYEKVGEERPYGDPNAPLLPIMKPLLASENLGPAGEKTIEPGRNMLDFDL